MKYKDIGYNHRQEATVEIFPKQSRAFSSFSLQKPATITDTNRRLSRHQPINPELFSSQLYDMKSCVLPVTLKNVNQYQFQISYSPFCLKTNVFNRHCTCLQVVPICLGQSFKVFGNISK